MNEWGKEIKKLFKKVKKLSLTKKIFLGLILFIFSLFFSWHLFDFYLFQYQEESKQTVDNFLSDLSYENYEDAYSIFADKYKKEVDYKTFKKTVSSFKSAYLDYEPNSFDINKTTIFLLPLGSPSLRYIGEISYEDGEKVEVISIFLWENKEWKLYLLEIFPLNRGLEEKGSEAGEGPLI